MSDTHDDAENIFTERTLGAHRLAQYVSRNRCERYLRLALFPSEAKTLAARYRVGFENLSPLLSESGQQFEREQVLELGTRVEVRNLQNTSGEAFVSALKSQDAGRRTFYYQARLEGRIGGCSCEGYPDLVEINRHGGDGSDTVDVTVIDIKASRRETVGFRLQVAFYARLLGDALRQAGLKPATFNGAIAARGSQLAPDRIERFDLSLYLDEIEQLVAAADSDVARASARGFTDAAYHLGAHCDGCPYNALCFIDTAEREDLSLVPTLTATEKSALHSVGVSKTRELARLLDYGRGAMLPAPGRERDVERIGARWPLGSRLPVLVQRARAALRRLDRSVEAKRYMLGADWGSLPDAGQYPNLIRVFVDAERDHLEDKVYLLAGVVAGPAGSIEIVENTQTKPDETSERALLVAWVARLLPAIARVADSNSAPVHIYLYDRRGQRSLLDALARHFAALCAIPAFYDLLTSTPALTQGMISFLAEEVGERLNLGAICGNLYEVAREMGYEWRDGEREFLKTFRARIFDNTRVFGRDARTGEFVAATPPEGDDRGAWVESAARFGTEIPLEYVYAAWGLLKESPEMQAQERTQIRGFVGTTIEDVRALAVERCRALQFIEESFAYKNRQVEKEPLSLEQLDRTEIDVDAVPLRRALEDFLYLEHHAKMQELLLHLSLPPEQRAAGGRTLVVRCASYERTERGEDRAEFDFSKTDGETLTITDMAALRFREGDWVVLNPLVDEAGKFLPARKLVRGRLAVVEELDEARVRLRLLSMNFKNSDFRYPHWSFKPEAGAICTIDAMADDLNADKFLDACRHAASNHLYHWLTNAEEGKRGRGIRPKRLRDATEITALASRAQAPHGLTGAQGRVVGGYMQERVLVLQGPPGTGKSHTLGFAVLARALALATPARPFRVAVAAKTHAASSIALASIASRARQLLRAGAGDARLAQLERLRVAKICNDAGEELAVGVEPLFADGGEESRAGEQWAMLLAEPLLVVGGTPGGIYNLVKKGASKGKAIDWTQELFDLVIVDEASQMGIAEALTASAFLRGDGQFIAIGDHRQMPPILAHAWDRESRRDLKHAQPHLSIFETLRAHGFASEALDQSFRIPAEIAGFLQRHIYAEDGINFRSDNRERMASDDALKGWLGAAFAPEHSLVVIEHDERGSQQSNEFEAALVESLAGVACEKLGCGGEGGIGVVVPHRAQKALLRARLPHMAHSIDTVERFQGGERELIILSATVSDREFARAESGFLLEPRRLTVAISRPKRKLIVIASRAVFDLIPAELDEYERGALWKYLRHECGQTTLWEGDIRGHRVRVRTLCE
ncbi:MAG TPA: AAA domain-containing protein [Pyrinomonadaceae bacterium]|nr:AAA domain-containing protein [Pyrinomonadaceae bacterium]